MRRDKLMKLHPIKVISLFLCLSLASVYAANSDYWTEFERENRKTGLSLINHIQNLAVISDSESAYVRNRRKEALDYFFATGGKHGFRKEPPTTSEYEILVKALAVTTALHYFKEESGPVLNLVQVRRRYSLQTEDASTQSHLIQAHAVIGCTVCVFDYLKVTSSATKGKTLSPPLVPKLIQRFCNFIQGCYVTPLNSFLSKLTDRDLKEGFVGGISPSVLRSVVVSIAPDYPRSIDGNKLARLQDMLIQSFSPPSPARSFAGASGVAGRRLQGVVLGNGATVARTNDGRISTNMFGGTMTGKRINVNVFLLDGGWTDDEFLAAMQSIGIVEVLYS